MNLLCAKAEVRVSLHILFTKTDRDCVRTCGRVPRASDGKFSESEEQGRCAAILLQCRHPGWQARFGASRDLSPTSTIQARALLPESVVRSGPPGPEPTPRARSAVPCRECA